MPGKHPADRLVVLLDADVLFPFRKRNILLRFYHAGLYHARCSDQILVEWTRHLLSFRPELLASINSQLDIMRSEFPKALVTVHEHLMEGVPTERMMREGAEKVLLIKVLRRPKKESKHRRDRGDGQLDQLDCQRSFG